MLLKNNVRCVRRVWWKRWKQSCNLQIACAIISTLDDFWEINLHNLLIISVAPQKNLERRLKCRETLIDGYSCSPESHSPAQNSPGGAFHCEHYETRVQLGPRLRVGPRLTAVSFYPAPISLQQFGGICCHLVFCYSVKSFTLNAFVRKEVRRTTLIFANVWRWKLLHPFNTLVAANFSMQLDVESLHVKTLSSILANSSFRVFRCLFIVCPYSS